MEKRLFKSIISLVAVLALGAGATYALFTSNTVTVSNNTLTTGEATIKLCNVDGDNEWQNSISPVFTLTDLVPGAVEEELSATAEIWLGNDGGGLVPVAPGKCTAYDAIDGVGSSDVTMNFVPVVTNLVCGDASLLNDLTLRLELNGTTMNTLSLGTWAANITAYGPTLAPDFAGQLKLYAALDSGATVQNTTCTFDVTFTGEQV